MAEDRVFHGLFGDQIHRSLEDEFQTIRQSHVAVEDTRFVGVMEFDYKIQVTALRIESICDDGSKDTQFANREVRAEMTDCVILLKEYLR